MSKLDALILNCLKAQIKKLNSFDSDKVLEILNSDDLIKKSVVVKQHIEKIIIYDDQIVMNLHGHAKSIIIDYHIAGHGRHSALLEPNSSIEASQSQKWSIIRSYLQGLIWQEELLEPPGKPISAIAAEYNKSAPHVLRLINFSFMAPALVGKILRGDILSRVTLQNLIFGWPIDWNEQSSRFERLMHHHHF